MGNLNTIPLGYLNMVFLSLEFIQFNVSGEKRKWLGLVGWNEKIVFY
jgi:hypothetical protein